MEHPVNNTKKHEIEKHRDNGERKLNFKDIALKMHLFVTCYICRSRRRMWNYQRIN